MPDAGQTKTEKLIGTMEWRLKNVYKEAAKESKEKLLKYYDKYKKTEEAKMRDLVNGRITQEEFIKWRQNAVASGKRYQELARTLAQDLTKTNEKAMSIVNGYIPEAYAINRNFTVFQMDVAGVPINGSFTLYDRHTVEKLVEERKTLLPKPKVDIPKDERWNKQHIRGAITQGVLQGESIPQIAKRLENVVGMDHRAAVRNARTAMTGAQNRGRVDGYADAKKRGVNVMQEWLATHDGRTRQSHLLIEGERVEVGEQFSNGCEYPGDPEGPPEEVYNCRCTLIPFLPDYDFSKEDNEKGDTASEKKFDEWAEEHIDDEQKRIEDAIANAQDYSYDWHEENDFSWEKWGDLPFEERRGIMDYTGSYYEEMNEAMREKNISLHGERIEKRIRDADRGMEKFELPEDMKLYRGMGSMNSLARALEISRDELEAAFKDGSIVGMRFAENGFASTAANWEKAWHKPVMLDIVAPKGTKGMYVDLISRHSGEKEIMLQNGTFFEIRSAGMAWHHYEEVMKLDVVVIGSKKIPGL